MGLLVLSWGCWFCDRYFGGFVMGLYWFCHEVLVGFVIGGMLVLSWGLVMGLLSRGFVGFVMRILVSFVIGVSWVVMGFCWFLNGVLLVLSMGFCWFCHDGFIGFVIRVMFGLPLVLFGFVIGVFGVVISVLLILSRELQLNLSCWC